MDPMDPYADKTSHNMMSQKPMIPNTMSNVMPNMSSPTSAHSGHPPHLSHVPDGHMMVAPHQQPMGGMPQMGVPHQQQGMPQMVHHSQGMPSPPGPMGSPMHMNNQVGQSTQSTRVLHHIEYRERNLYEFLNKRSTCNKKDDK